MEFGAATFAGVYSAPARELREQGIMAHLIDFGLANAADSARN